MQLAACPRNGTGLQASARPARGDPASLFCSQQSYNSMIDQTPRLHTLKNPRRTHAGTNTHRHHTVFQLSAAQSVDERSRAYRAGGT